MKGIAGIISYNQQPPHPADCASLRTLLAHRGAVTGCTPPDGLLLCFGGPMPPPEPGTYLAVADADEFTKLELTTCLSIALDEEKTIDVFNGLSGSFAVAGWNEARKTLVLARDVMGTKPLYYTHQPGQFVAFSSEIKSLLALINVPVVPNEAQFRDYLTWPTDYVPYPSDTYYQGIFSVLPGHAVWLTPANTSTRPYWTIRPGTLAGLHTPAEYAARFRHHFTTAINRTMTGHRQVGSHLSGGLDSSAVSGVAQGLLVAQQRPALHTFSIDTGQPAADEQAFVQAVVAQWHTHHHRVQPLPGVLEVVKSINRLFDRPEQFIIPSSFHFGAAQAAQQAGCDLVLTGHDGDSVIPTGFDYIDQLLDADEWDDLERACRQYVSFPARNLASINSNWPRLSESARYEAYVLAVVKPALKRLWQTHPPLAFLRATASLTGRLHLPPVGLLVKVVKRIKGRLLRKQLIISAFNPEFARRVGAQRTRTTAPLARQLSLEHGIPVSQVLNNTNVLGNEQLNHIGASFGHAYGFPFFDREVLELGLLTPLKIHFDAGRGRGLLRNGLPDVLPPAVLARLSKANFVEYGTLTAQQLYTAVYESIKGSDHPVWGVIDRGVFGQIMVVVFNPKFPAIRKTRYNWLLSRIIYLALWLDSLPPAR